MFLDLRNDVIDRLPKRALAVELAGDSLDRQADGERLGGLGELRYVGEVDLLISEDEPLGGWSAPSSWSNSGGTLRDRGNDTGAPAANHRRPNSYPANSRRVDQDPKSPTPSGNRQRGRPEARLERVHVFHFDCQQRRLPPRVSGEGFESSRPNRQRPLLATDRVRASRTAASDAPAPMRLDQHASQRPNDLSCGWATGWLRGTPRFDVGAAAGVPSAAGLLR